MTRALVRTAPRQPPMRALPHKRLAPLPVPDIITFVLGEQWLDRRLYPKQATALKAIFLRDDLFTDYDIQVLTEWSESFAATGDNGCQYDIFERIRICKEQGRPWFREVILVMGRRAGKGYVCALAMAYVLWRYLATANPQKHFGIDRGKQFTGLIYAVQKELAKANLWGDFNRVVTEGPCFTPYVAKPLAESLTLFAPNDFLRINAMRARGMTVDPLEMASFRIDPLPAKPTAGRGGASFLLGLDEEAHIIATGANRSAKEIWKAAQPALDQFKRWGFICEPSSPWDMTGQFYENAVKATLVEPDGTPTYPEIFLLQLASWEIYYDWERADQIPVFPEDFDGDLGEYAEDADHPSFGTFVSAPQEYDDDMRKEEKADPDTFSVERLAKWQTTLDAYLDPKKIAAMWDPELAMQSVGRLDRFYKAHADASLVNDNFGFSVAHTETNEDGFEVVVFDLLHHWDPANFPGHTINYLEVNEQLWDYVKAFPIDDLSFDQFQSAYFIADLQEKAMGARLPKRIHLHVETATAPRQLRTAQTFKIALNQGWIRAPFYKQADDELKFLQFVNGKVVHQTTGPVVHDDVARTMFEVVHNLLERQVNGFLSGIAPAPIGTLMGGSRPWTQAPTAHDQSVMEQFSQPRQGPLHPAFSPARGGPPGVGSSRGSSWGRTGYRR